MSASNPHPPGAETFPDGDRFSRQTRFAPIGEAGLARLAQARVAVVGLGALGAASAMLLLRAGVRHLTLIDRDIVERSNLPRQVLYTERDAELGLPKAAAARDHLLEIDARASLTVWTDDLVASNVARLLQGAELIVDGLDNLATRYLLNDYAVKHARPWVYGGAIAGAGLVLPVRPRTSACLRCVFPDPPDASQMETCDTAGVLSPLPTLVAAIQVTEAIKLLVGANAQVMSSALSIEAWDATYHAGLKLERRAECPCCGRGEFPFLQAGSEAATAMCGRDVVQVRPQQPMLTDLAAFGARLRAVGPVQVHAQFVRFAADGVEFTVFAGGRALLRGTSDAKRARSLYARYVGA